LGFLDVIYLGIFTILSPAFDSRFYHPKPSHHRLEEVANARDHFHCLLRVFSTRFIILLEAKAVVHTYVVDRMLAEFAAAAVNFAMTNDEVVDVAGRGEIPTSAFVGRIDGILQEFYPRAFPYYTRCLSGNHKQFIWTGPQIQILPRSEGVSSTLPLMTLGEMRDLSDHQIYEINIDPTPSSSPSLLPLVGKRRERAESLNLADGMSKKQKRKL
jgi:hypothetical protein